MSSAGRAASSSGCVAKPRGRETGLTGCAEPIQRSLPTGGSAMETAEHREPYESRGSRTDLGAPGGETPPGDSTIPLAWRFLRFQKDSALARWYQARTADRRAGTRKTMIVALARKLLIVLWRFVTTGETLEGVVLRPAG